MTAALGLHAPYDWRYNPETWRLLEKYRPGCVVISSHEPTLVYDRLLQLLPDVNLVIRLKGSRGWCPDANQPLDRREWSDEATPAERLSWLLDTEPRMAPGRLTVALWTEPDIEWTRDGEAPGGGWWSDNDAERWRAWGLYHRTARVAAEQLAQRFPGVHVSLAPLSQGNPERYAWWSDRYRESGLWRLCDRRVEHAYLPADRPLDDPDWGWRPFARDSGCDLDLPIILSEVNSNGPADAGRLAEYAGLVRTAVESLCLFILPGGAQDGANPSWWLMDDATIGAVADALQNTLSNMPEIMPGTPEAPRMATIDTLRAVRWGAIDPTIPYNPATAIATYWQTHQELGSALSPEVDLEDGTRGQAFVNGYVVWDAENGARAA